jgi:hypothetical protein
VVETKSQSNNNILAEEAPEEAVSVIYGWRPYLQGAAAERPSVGWGKDLEVDQQRQRQMRALCPDI